VGDRHEHVLLTADPGADGPRLAAAQFSDPLDMTALLDGRD